MVNTEKRKENRVPPMKWMIFDVKSATGCIFPTLLQAVLS
jgi:hypothetical protein